MKLILFEGQPGSGKTIISEIIFQKFIDSNKKCILIDEHEQDNVIFTDYWEDLKTPYQESMMMFLESWNEFYHKIVMARDITIMDNALLNQIQYLMALNAPKESIVGFFKNIVNLFTKIEVKMIFMDGNSEIVINRVNEVRKNNWGTRVSDFIANTPYQKDRNRTGIEGMVRFFNDAQKLKRRILENWPYSKITIDVTNGEWEKYEKVITEFVL